MNFRINRQETLLPACEVETEIAHLSTVINSLTQKELSVDQVDRLIDLTYDLLSWLVPDEIETKEDATHEP